MRSHNGYAEGMASQPLVLKEAVSKLSTSYHGELRAMLLATQFSKEYSSTHHRAKHLHRLPRGNRQCDLQ